MANEIKVTSGLEVENESFRTGQLGGRLLQFDQTGQGGGVPGLIEATTAGVDADLSALTTPGWAYFRNLDDTNFVQIGHWSGSTFYPFAKMKPGEPAGPIRLDPALTLRFKADTANCLVQACVMED